ncbi:MAG: monovalent cation/H+ antiporter complex subunit F [Lachnospiraceae bacterium]|nr:monovalent cation/H+ antiporter complex subunit F [Lachnospiraceae bacterium]
MDINEILELFMKIVIALSSLCIFICLIRAAKGPTIADRLVAVNMIGTQVIIIICVLTVFLHEDWLADIACVYAMISFLAVVVLTKIYIGVYRKKLALSNEKNQKSGNAKN